MKLEILLAMALYKIVENYFKAANAHIWDVMHNICYSFSRHCWQRLCTTMWQRLQMSWLSNVETFCRSWSRTLMVWKGGGSVRSVGSRGLPRETGSSCCQEWRRMDTQKTCTKRHHRPTKTGIAAVGMSSAIRYWKHTPCHVVHYQCSLRGPGTSVH